MSKKIKILIAVGVAAVLLIAGIAIPVLADTPTPTPPAALTKTGGVLERTAQILGIPAEKLLYAEYQARQQLRQQPRGTTPTPLTPDDYYARVAQLAGVSKDALVNAMQQAAKQISDEALANQLAQAVKNGKITQDEANQIKDWISKRPSAVDKLFGLRGFGGMMGGRIGGMMRGFQGFGGPGFGPGCGGRGFRGGLNRNAPNPSKTPTQ